MSFRIRWKFWGFNPPNPLFSSRLLLDLPIFHFQSSIFVLFPSILCFVLVFLGLNSGDGAEASRAFWSVCVCCLVDSFWDSWILMDTNNWRPAQAEPASSGWAGHWSGRLEDPVAPQFTPKDCQQDVSVVCLPILIFFPLWRCLGSVFQFMHVWILRNVFGAV